MDAEALGLLREVLVALVSAGAVYGGIRADLRHALQGMADAHRRIDQLMMKGKVDG